MPEGRKDRPAEALRPLRADARVNRKRILAAAGPLLVRDGAAASLEEIARRAGVGSATLHRHFPSRRALLEVVSLDQAVHLRDLAGSLAAEHPAGVALLEWLRAVGSDAAANRGLAVALAEETGPGPSNPLTGCREMVSAAGAVLVDAAVASGAVRPDVSISDLLTLINAVSLATGNDAARGRQLLDLALTGIRPRASNPGQPDGGEDL